MIIVKRLLQLQLGRFNFCNNNSLNIIGAIGGKKARPFMDECVLVNVTKINGFLYPLSFKNVSFRKDMLEITNANITGSLESIV